MAVLVMMGCTAHYTVNNWEKAVTDRRCQNLSVADGKKKTGANSEDRNCAVKTYLIEVSLEQTPTESERQKLLNLPTSFYLKPEDIDRLKAAAHELFSSSVEFQDLVFDLQ